MFLSILCLSFLLPSSAWAKWTQVTSENFIVIGDGREKNIQKLALELERYRLFLSKITGTEYKSEALPVRVYAFYSTATFGRSFYSDSAAGVYAASLDGPIFIAYTGRPETKISLTGDSIIKHEYVHHYMYSAGQRNYPAWYREGLADFFSTYQYKDGISEVGLIIPSRTYGLKAEKWLGWAKIFTGTSNFRTKNKYEYSRAYSQSWIAVHYLQLNTERRTQLGTYLSAIRGGSGVEQAMAASFGVTRAQLGKEIRDYYRKGTIPLLRMKLDVDDYPTTLKTEKISKAESKFQLVYAGSFFAKGNSEEQKEFRKTTRQRLEKYLKTNPSDIRALAALAEVSLHDDLIAEATNIVIRAKQTSPDHALTAFIEGLLLSEKGQKLDGLEKKETVLQARDLFDKARKQNPLLAKAHYGYAYTWYLLGDKVTEEAILAAQTVDQLTAETHDVPFIFGTLLLRGGHENLGRPMLQQLYNTTTSLQMRIQITRELNR